MNDAGTARPDPGTGPTSSDEAEATRMTAADSDSDSPVDALGGGRGDTADAPGAGESARGGGAPDVGDTARAGGSAGTAADAGTATGENTATGSSTAAGAATATSGAGDAPGAAAGNPFADLRAGDLIRDAVAVTLLLISFGLPWNIFDSATGVLYVVFATLLSIASVALPYLRRGGILPATWNDGTIRGARLLANVPYLVVVLITLVLGYVGGGAGPGGGEGLGVGVAFGLAGAVLAAQPRSSERPSEVADASLWRLVVAVLGLVTVVLTVTSAVFALVDAEGAEWSDIVFVIVYLLFFAAVALIPVWRLWNGGGPARDVLIVLGGVGLLAAFWMLGAASGAGTWSVRYSGPVIVFWPALAAAASAASLPVVLETLHGSRRWTTLALRLFRLTVVAAGLAAVLAAVSIAQDDIGRGTEITVLVVLLLVVVAALVGRNALATDAKVGRPAALVAAGVFIVAGIVYAAVAANSDSGFNILAAVVVSLLFVFAASIGYALLVPAAVRADLGPVGAVSPAFLRSRSNGTSAGGGDADTDVPGSDAGATADSPAGTGAAAAGSPAASGADTGSARGTGAVGGAAAAGGASAGAGAGGAGTGGAGTGGAGADPDATVLADGLASDVTEQAGRPEAQPARGSDSARTSSAIGPDDATRVDMRAQTRETGPSGTDRPAATPAAGTGRYTPQQAADPNTPLQTLADIAGSEPALRPYVASNPSAYPELLTWLGQLGDPAVDEALRRRQG